MSAIDSLQVEPTDRPDELPIQGRRFGIPKDEILRRIRANETPEAMRVDTVSKGYHAKMVAAGLAAARESVSTVSMDPRLAQVVSARLALCGRCQHYIAAERNCAKLKTPAASCNAHYRRVLTRGLGHPSPDCLWNVKG